MVRTPVDDLIAKLAAAARAEADARNALRKHRSEIASLLAAARAAGLDDHRIARKFLRHRLGRAPTVAEILRERERVKKRRQRGTACPANVVGRDEKEMTAAPAPLRSPDKEVDDMSKHLVRRRVTEEEFVVTGRDAKDAIEEEAPDDGEEEDEDEDE